MSVSKRYIGRAWTEDEFGGDKAYGKKACEDQALEYLNRKKAGHSKVLHLSHSKWGTQPYLQPNQMSADDAKFILLLRTRLLDVKLNYRNKHSNLSCPCCESALDDQEHLLDCAKLVDSAELVEDGFKYENIRIFRRFQTNFKIRKYLIKQPNVAHVNQC